MYVFWAIYCNMKLNLQIFLNVYFYVILKIQVGLNV